MKHGAYLEGLASCSRQLRQIAVYAFILSILSTQFVLPGFLGYLFGIFGYCLLAIVFYLSGDLSGMGDRTILFAILCMSVVFAVPVVQSPNLPGSARLAVFPLIIIFNLFIIPTNINRNILYGALSRLTALLILIGLPATITGAFGPVPSYWVVSRPPGFPFALHGLTSFFGNPNTLGAIAAIAALAALWEYYSTQSFISIPLFLVNSSGVYFSQGRAAALALVAGLVLIAVYRFLGYRALLPVTILGLTTAPTVVLVKFGVIPGPAFIRGLDFNNRVQLWSAAYQAFLDRPLFGWGLGEAPNAMLPYIERGYLRGAGPHTSYVRFFVASGVLGGLLYLFICMKCMVNRLRTVVATPDVVEFGMVVAVLVLHTFGGNSIFGLAAVSVIPAILLGYAQSSVYDRISVARGGSTNVSPPQSCNSC